MTKQLPRRTKAISKLKTSGPVNRILLRGKLN